jgi:DNA-binding transcriptional regulator YdaS (Cro superfamily)
MKYNLVERPVVEDEDAKQNIAVELLPIVGNREKVADLISVDPQVIDYWMTSVDFLGKLFPKLESSKAEIRTKTQQQILEMKELVWEKYMELSKEMNVKSKRNENNTSLVKHLGQQFNELVKLLRLYSNEPTVIEERHQAPLMEELNLLPSGKKIEVIELLARAQRITDSSENEDDGITIDV